VSWHSILQYIVALSTIEAEYMTMTEAMKEAIWLQGLVDDLGIDQDLLKINCDSMTAIYLAKNQVYMQGRSTLTLSSTLFGRFLLKVTLSYKRFTERRIARICLPRWFREWNLHIVKSCSIFFQLLELGGARLDKLQMAWSGKVRRQPHRCSHFELIGTVLSSA